MKRILVLLGILVLAVSLNAKDIFVNFVLDETGSMQNNKAETIEGINEYLSCLRERKENIFFSLTKFNAGKIEVVCVGENIDNVSALNVDTYNPNSMTPLYDAIMKSILSTEREVDELAVICGCCGQEVPQPVLFVVFTDGLENASCEYGATQVRDKIKEKEEEGWTFAYLGANHDSWAVGGHIGFYGGNTITVDQDSMIYNFHLLNNATDCYINSGATQTTNFFEMEKKQF